MKIRRAEREDVPTIVGLLADDVLGASQERAETPLRQAYFGAFDRLGPENAIYVAELDGEIVGCLQLTFIADLSRLGMTRAQSRAFESRPGTGVPASARR